MAQPMIHDANGACGAARLLVRRLIGDGDGFKLRGCAASNRSRGFRQLKLMILDRFGP